MGKKKLRKGKKIFDEGKCLCEGFFETRANASLF